MRRPLLSGPNGDELAINLDNGRIVDLHIARHLRLRLGRSEGRDKKKRERQPKRSGPLFFAKLCARWILLYLPERC